MASKKVVILIDGQNLFYSLKNLHFIERDINWGVFFESLMSPEDELIRTYWFRPQKILDSYYTTSNITNYIIYKKYNNYLDAYKADYNSIPDATRAKIEKDVKDVEDWLKAEKAKFSQIEYNYDQISLDYQDIEIVKTGIVKINPYLKEYIGEKGVDISLAVKMIALSVEKRCDKIVLISGDYDYAEAIKFVKNNMTKIHIVRFHKGYPPKNRNMSRDLSILADNIIDVYESQIKSSFLKNIQQSP